MKYVHRFKTRKISQALKKELKLLPTHMVYDYLEGRLIYGFKPELALSYAMASPNPDHINNLMRPLTWKCWDPMYLSEEEKAKKWDGTIYMNGKPYKGGFYAPESKHLKKKVKSLKEVLQQTSI